MSRLPLTMEDEIELQQPVLEALDAYFDAAYTPDSECCSVGTAAASGDSDTVLVMSAFRVPRGTEEVVRNFLMSQAMQFAKTVTLVDVPPDFSKTTH